MRLWNRLGYLGIPAKSAMLMFAFVAFVEFLVMMATPFWGGQIGLSAAALGDGLVVAVSAATLHLFAYAKRYRYLDVLIEASALGLCLLGGEAVLHPVVVAEYGQNSTASEAVNALTLSTVAGLVAAWLAIIRLETEKARFVDRRRQRRHVAPKLMGALVIAGAVAGITAVHGYSEFRRAEAQSGLSRLEALYTRQQARLQNLYSGVAQEGAQSLRTLVGLREAARRDALEAAGLSQEMRLQLGQGDGAVRWGAEVDLYSALILRSRDSGGSATYRRWTAAEIRTVRDEWRQGISKLILEARAMEVESDRLWLWMGPMVLLGFTAGLLWPVLRLLEAQSAAAQQQAVIVRGARNAIAQLDQNLRIVWSNEAWNQCIHAPPFSSFDALFESGTINLLDGVWAEKRRTLIEKGALRTLLSIVPPEGKAATWDVDIQASRAPDDWLEGYECIATDVTDLFATKASLEAALESAERRDSQITSFSELAAIGPFEIDLETGETTCDPAALRLLDVPSEEWAKPLSEFGFLERDSDRKLRQAIAQAIRTDSGFDVVLPATTAAGRAVFLRCVGRGLPLGLEPSRVIGGFMDVTVVETAARTRQQRSEALSVASECQSAFLSGELHDAVSIALEYFMVQSRGRFGLIGQIPVVGPGELSIVIQSGGPSAGMQAGEVAGVEVPLGSPLDLAIRSGEPAVLEAGAQGMPGALPLGGGARIAVLPVRVGSTTVGAVCLSDPRPNFEAAAEVHAPVLAALGGILLAAHDRNERRRAQAAALAEYQRADQALKHLSAYQAALDAGAIFAVTDASGRITSANEKFCEISGYSEAELIGQSHRVLNSGLHEGEFFHGLWRTISSGNPWSGEICNRRKDGSLYWVDTMIVPICDATGRPQGYASIRYDITSRKQADSAVREALGQLSRFFEVSPDVLCILDEGLKVFRISAAASHVLQRDAEAVVGACILEIIDPDDRTIVQSALDEAAFSGRSVKAIAKIITPNSAPNTIEWVFSCVDGIYYAAARNISDRIEYELNLERARDAAEAANRAKSAFLANMSHEIRTPLNGVIGIAGTLARSSLNSSQREMVELIRNSGETLEILLSDILDYSKIEAGKFELSFAPFDLREAVSSAAHLMQVRADDKGIGFSVTFEGSPEGLYIGDAVRIRQIVSNLASNAVKFTETGGVEVTVSAQDVGSLQSRVTIGVRDTGIGIDEETVGRLFSRFEQADDSISRKFGGTGLGLAICKSLAEAMGGSVSVSSRVGEGSLFKVEFPLQRALVAEADLAEVSGIGTVEGDLRPDAPVRVLLAEDHPVNQRVIGILLEPFGVELKIVADGVQAVSAYQDGSFDAILMDMQMPNVDGLEATREIRRLEREHGRERTPIIMLSANAMAEHIALATDAGCDGHLSKPVTQEQLLATLERALSSAH